MDGGQWIERRRPAKGRGVRKILTVLSVWNERARERRQLATLDDRLLSDIGISRCDVVREYDKPFWES
jgi:uncharacterized protein YjiS (DUF1127 family)